MRMNKKFVSLAGIAIAAMFCATVFAQFYLNRPVGNTGRVVTFRALEVYAEIGCTTPITTIAWGNTLYRNTNYTKSLWLKNTGDATIWTYWNSTGLDTGITTSMLNGTVTWIEGASGSELLSAGEVRPITYKLMIGPTAVLDANIDWTLNLYTE